MRISGDLHIHSTESDGKPSPREVVLEAINKGLNAISITDHDTFRGSLKAARYARDITSGELVVVIGAEIRVAEGDILVYCPESPLDRIPRTATELVDEAHANNCITVAAHPYDLIRKGIGDLVKDIDIDAIEVFNAHSPPNANERALKVAKELSKPGIANSDAHILDEIGSTYTLYDVEELSPEAVIDAIRLGQTILKPGRPTFSAIVKRFMWSVERHITRHRKREFNEGVPRYGWEEI